MEIVAVVVLCVFAIAAANTFAPRLRVAAPLLLVGVGVVVSFLPRVPAISIDPEIILVGLLPPLLFAAAVAMPAMDFKRDFRAIGALSILLVIISSLVLGLFFTWVFPDMNYALGVALGAILSPTDAVATGVIKRIGAPGRIVTVLSGESLFNDASALVVLRTAVAATAASISFGGAALNFLWSLLAAIAVGAAIGVVHSRVRARIGNPAVATAVSFTAPYLAYLPAELLDASGLVAAVAAGLVVGRSSMRLLTAAHRQSDRQAWHTVELVLEGAVFLMMGLELKALVNDVANSHDSWTHALWPALGAFALVLVIRLGFVMPLLWFTGRRHRRLIATAPTLEAMKDQLPDELADTAARRYSIRLDRRLSDIAYYSAARMGPREGMVVVWGGLRGVVTLAAAQTLPAETPHRSLLVLVAFLVAALSLALQGGLMGPVVRALRLPDQSADVRDERLRLRGEMIDLAQGMLRDPEVIGDDSILANQVKLVRQLETPEDDDETQDVLSQRLENARALRKVRRSIIAEQRAALLSYRDRGTYSSDALTAELAKLDAEELSLNVSALPAS